MLMSVQIPFADLRPFLGPLTARLERPIWSGPELGQEFVRNFGTVLPRNRGGVSEWPGEEFYCRANNVIRFGSALDTFARNNRAFLRDPLCAYRRFMYDGRAVSRIEVGFGNRGATLNRKQMSAQRCLSILHELLTLPVRVGGSRGMVETELQEASKPLSRAYLRASTGKAIEEPQQWWFAAGRLLTVVEYDERELESLPRQARHVAMDEKLDIQLNHLRTSAKGRIADTWFIGHTSSTSREALRRLRVHLSRLHSEKECLRQVLRAIAANRLSVTARTPEANRLQDYLLDALRMLSRKTRHKWPQSAILKAALESDDLVTPGERASLLASLAPLRPNIVKGIARVAVAEPTVERPVHVFGGTALFVQGQVTKEGSIVVTHNEVSFGDGATIHGDFVVANTIKGSFHKIKDAQAPDQLRESLETLVKAVAELTQHLDVAKAREVSRDLDTLTAEAISTAPRRKMWEVSASGLMDAAKALSAIGAPVVEAVTRVMALLT